MTRYANRYLVLTAIGWQGKTLPAGASLIAEPGSLSKTTALLEQGAIRPDPQAHTDHEPIVVAPASPKPDSAVAFDCDPAPTDGTGAAGEQEVPLETLTVAQLTELATSMEIELLGVKKKADIIELIAAALAAGTSDEAAGTQEGAE